MAAEPRENQALQHFGLEETPEEILEQQTEFTHSHTPQYPVTMEKHSDKTSRNQGTHYRVSKNPEEHDINTVSIEKEGLDIEKIHLNPETGETRLEFTETRDEEPRRYQLLTSTEQEALFIAEIGYGERTTAQLKYNKQTQALQGRKEPGENWKNYQGARENHRTQLIEHILTEIENSRQKEEQQINCQSKLDRLIPIYKAVTNRIKQDGKAIITEQTHVGSSRGGDIKQYFKQAVKRVEDDSISNYEIENDGNGYPIVISSSEE